MVIICGCSIFAFGMGALYFLGIFPPLPRCTIRDFSSLRAADQQPLISQAAAYLKQLHWSVSSTPTLDSFSGNRIRLEYRNVNEGLPQITLVIAAKTGKLLSAENRLHAASYPLTAAKLKPDIALALSRRYAGIAGFSLDGLQLTGNHTMHSNTNIINPWVVSYQRAYHNYCFNRDLAVFVLNPATGDLLRMAIYISSPLPHSTVPRISKGLVERLATVVFIAKTGIYPFPITSSELVIVSYGDDDSGTPYGSRLAWDVSFTSRSHQQANVWIDATACRVIGIGIANGLLPVQNF